MNNNRPNGRKRITAPSLIQMKARGQKVAMLTAYDYNMARILDEFVDVLLVGDSLAMVVQGRENTLPVTLDEIIYHAEMVGRATNHALLVTDLPFPVNHLGVHQTVAAAGRILKETRSQAVKLEGGAGQAEVIASLVAAGVPVMAHVGLRPQSVHAMGGYKIQRDEKQLLADAKTAEQAGAFSIVLECIPATIARKISRELAIPTIGIGAGPDCDGQVLVINDLLGMTSGYVPSFAKKYADVNQIIRDAAATWCKEVREAIFPAIENFDS